jgi:hypothetical protein
LVTASNRDLIGPVYPWFRAGRVSTAIGKALWAQPITSKDSSSGERDKQCVCMFASCGGVKWEMSRGDGCLLLLQESRKSCRVVGPQLEAASCQAPAQSDGMPH